MDWQALSAEMPNDADYPARTHRLERLTRVLDGRMYDHIAAPFSDEKSAGGEYVPIRARRPSVRTDLPRIVVDDSVSLLFDEGHFPEFTGAPEATIAALQDIARTVRLNARMIEAATTGSVGSVALLLRFTDGRPRVDVMGTCYLTPTFDPADGETLTGCVEAFKLPREEWQARGVTLPGEDSHYWWRREWTATQEIVFQPQSLADRREGRAPVEMPPAPTGLGTVTHGLGFVPIVWVRNLPGGDGVDGASTMTPAAIGTTIEADYQLSQAGRGLKYASDPTLLIKEPALEGNRIGGAATALIVSSEGDAKLLEISGSAAAAVIEYVRALRDIALESMHGNRSHPEKMSAAQSGRAMELMHQPLIWLADRLRISYGETGLMALLRMICAASSVVPIRAAGQTFTALSADGLALRWPPWFAATHEDKLAQSQTLAGLKTAGLMSTATAVGSLAAIYDVEDVEAEIAAIEAEAPEPEPTTPEKDFA